MKVRNGFVSNSSSMSSIIFPKDNDILLDETDPIFTDKWRFLHLEVLKEDYSRGRNEILLTIEDKLRFYIAMYACYYRPMSFEDKTQEASNNRLTKYFDEMDKIVGRIKNIAKKYNVKVSIGYPPVSSSMTEVYDEDLKASGLKIRTYDIDVYTENDFYPKMAEFDDITLEKFLFDRRSFAIVGGDEYYFPQVAEYIMKKGIDYEYERLADYEDIKAGDRYGEGPNDVWECDHVWGERIPSFCLDKNGNLLPSVKLNGLNETLKKLAEDYDEY